MAEAPRGTNPEEPISPILLDRARRALDRDYEVGPVVGAGGMGFVLEALHRRLARKVAIKILRPEHATAAGASRFLAEARLLARLDHPNVVTVYDAGEVDGLLYYVMEYIAGQTLADRIRTGPLAPEEFGSFADDLLAGIHAVHRIGVIHRDIKPANVFLHEGRALLADFGIARESESGESLLTAPGHLIGTPRYMAPEQRDGKVVTSRTDLYAAGLVLWEAGTGTGWPETQTPEHADWSKFSLTRASALRRALAREPDRRWPDASSFRNALRRRAFSRAGLLAGGLLVALVLAGLWLIAGRSRGGVAAGRGTPLVIAVAPFEVSPAVTSRGLGDSIAVTMVSALRGYPDFNPQLTRGTTPEGAVAIRGSVTVIGDSVRLSLAGGTIGSWVMPPAGPISGLRGELRSLVDSLSVLFARAVWSQQPGAVELAAALPRSRNGFSLWFQGEQLWSRAEWGEAGKRYRLAEQQDSTCLLCSYRLLDIARWEALEKDPKRLARVARAVDSFPLRYQILIRAADTTLPGRLDLLGDASAAYPEFFLASFEYGDELLHRGPLYGRLRAEASEPLTKTIQLRPGFGPALEHQAWLLIWMGDSAGARRALDALGDAQVATEFTAALRGFLNLGFQWRFAPVDSARRYTRRLLDQPDIRDSPLTVAGARLMMTLNAPRGAVELGAMLAAQGGNEVAVREGLLGMLYGYASLGRLDSTRVVGARLAQMGDRSLALLALELNAILASFDPDSAVRADRFETDQLERYQDARLNPPEIRRRAAWVAGVIAARTGDSARFTNAHRALEDEPEPRSMIHILDAVRIGAQGEPARAMGVLPSLPSLDALPEFPDVMMDAVVHLLRAEWLTRQGEVEQARRTLRWHEHMEVMGHGGGPPHAGEPAWAMNALASWLRASLLEQLVPADPLGSSRIEQCSAYRTVADFWDGAPAPYGQRAVLARSAANGPACRSHP